MLSSGRLTTRSSNLFRYLIPQPTQYQQCIWRFINISQTFMAALFCVHTMYIDVKDGLKILDPSSSACHEIARHHIVHNRPQQNGVPKHKGWKFYNPTTKRTVIPECAVFDERYFLGLKNWSSVPAFCSHLLPSFWIHYLMKIHFLFLGFLPFLYFKSLNLRGRLLLPLWLCFQHSLRIYNSILL